MLEALMAGSLNCVSSVSCGKAVAPPGSLEEAISHTWTWGEQWWDLPPMTTPCLRVEEVVRRSTNQVDIYVDDPPLYMFCFKDGFWSCDIRGTGDYARTITIARLSDEHGSSVLIPLKDRTKQSIDDHMAPLLSDIVCQALPELAPVLPEQTYIRIAVGFVDLTYPYVYATVDGADVFVTIHHEPSTARVLHVEVTRIDALGDGNDYAARRVKI